MMVKNEDKVLSVELMEIGDGMDKVTLELCFLRSQIHAIEIVAETSDDHVAQTISNLTTVAEHMLDRAYQKIEDFWDNMKDKVPATIPAGSADLTQDAKAL